MTSKIAPAWKKGWDFLHDLPPKRCLQAALAVWLIFALIVAVVVAVQPDRHTATLEYQKASSHWWKSETLYVKKNGYLYLPQEAMLYTPFELLPDRVGEPLWRLTLLATLAGSLMLASRHLAPARWQAVFLVASVLVIPSALSSARNGQVNMPLGALYLFIAVAIAGRRWMLAAVLLALCLALKPISIVPVLLCGALYPRLWLPLLVSLTGMFAVAYLHPDTAFVSEQYRIFWETLMRAGKPTSHTWCDFAGMYRSAGMQLPDKLQLAIRGLAAMVTLGLCWKASRIKDAMRSSFVVLFLATMYLMLFNPRTETNSYVMLGTFIAIWGAYEGLVTRNLRAAAWLVAFAAFLGSESYGWPIFPWTNLWAKALITCFLGIWLVGEILKRPMGETVILSKTES